MPQGTIKSYDAATHSGFILDDRGNEIVFDLESFRGSGVREFRLGQRVKFELVGEIPGSKVRGLTIVSL